MLNCPLPDPWEPKLKKVPPGSSRMMRLLPVSATQAEPPEPTATPNGLASIPIPIPVTRPPVGLVTMIRLFTESAT